VRTVKAVFVEALKRAAEFTGPVVTSMRHRDGTVACGAAAFVVVNDEGWIVTAAHVLNASVVFDQHRQELAAYELRVQQIDASGATQKAKNKQLRSLPTNDKWITNMSYWWARDGISITDVKILEGADLAIGKVDPFDPAFVKTYPTFKVPPDMEPGRSLCRLGYPFYEISATYDSAADVFALAPGTLPIPRFPLEGIFTRNIAVEIDPAPPVPIRLLETSTPGLRGQSGGPIFDVDGRVWGIQTHTAHFPLGFSPEVTDANGRTTVENQFLNVGQGVHSETVVAFLAHHGVTVATA
jgi:trypsin-like peptidase